mmetsp:Transcript_97775/g.224187  ORF Transcript_97775/g.224187 Transcript_97775/m.224187 type:complete len:348 (-) Transcript_97775:1503-2546(-)
MAWPQLEEKKTHARTKPLLGSAREAPPVENAAPARCGKQAGSSRKGKRTHGSSARAAINWVRVHGDPEARPRHRSRWSIFNSSQALRWPRLPGNPQHRRPQNSKRRGSQSQMNSHTSRGGSRVIPTPRHQYIFSLLYPPGGASQTLPQLQNRNLHPGLLRRPALERLPPRLRLPLRQHPQLLHRKRQLSNLRGVDLLRPVTIRPNLRRQRRQLGFQALDRRRLGGGGRPVRCGGFVEGLLQPGEGLVLELGGEGEDCDQILVGYGLGPSVVLVGVDHVGEGLLKLLRHEAKIDILRLSSLLEPEGNWPQLAKDPRHRGVALLGRGLRLGGHGQSLPQRLDRRLQAAV